MWPFKKQDKQVQKVFVKKIFYKEERPYEVGKAIIELTFEDGFKMDTDINGYVFQFINNSYSRLINDSISEVEIINAKNAAMAYLASISTIERSQYKKYSKDREVFFYYGKVKSAKLKKILPHTQMFKEAYLEEVYVAI